MSILLKSRFISKILPTCSRPLQRPVMSTFRNYSNAAPKTHMSSRDYNSLFWKSLLVMGVTGAGLFGYFQYEKAMIALRREESKNQAVGTPKVGGPFFLVDHHGQPVSDLDYRGKYMLMYFGYTFCPDICPEELEKMAEIVDTLKKEKNYTDETIVPLFISCDPKRDSVGSIREYVKEFHPTFVGLTGTYQQIKKVAKAYRLYFSAPPRAMDDDETDYLVDHSIFFYLVDPEGKYICHFGRTDFAEDASAKIMSIIDERRQTAKS